MSPLLRLEKVSKTYPASGSEKTHQVLKDVTLDLEAGQALGIVGESGAGKSTLVRIIMGLERPSSGTARFDGWPLFFLTGRERHGLKKDIQLIWQDPVSFLGTPS